MEIKYLDKNTIDVFYGQGWENWGRFKVNRFKNKIFFQQIKGDRFPKDVYEALLAKTDI